VRWWKDKTPPDPEIQAANAAFVYFMLSVLGGFFWLLGYLYGSADWLPDYLPLPTLPSQCSFGGDFEFNSVSAPY